MVHSAAMLQEGQSVRLVRHGEDVEVGPLLGEGGEGAVFAAQRHRLAIKWYHPGSATPLKRAGIEYLLDIGRPHHRFVWPEDIVEAATGAGRHGPGAEAGFGYVMPLLPPGYVEMSAIRQGQAPGLVKSAQMGFELADAFLRVHSLGLCYRDINFRNILFHPDDGHILICDNDNIGIDGSRGGVYGVEWFMAPEMIIRLLDKAWETHPNRRTDLHSLAVLLFELLMGGHPLDGLRSDDYDTFDRPERMDLFGPRALFVYDPDDRANAPIPGFHQNVIDNWPVYPQFIRDLFTEAFTVGLRDPDARVPESVWRKAMVRLAGAGVPCSACARENFYGGPTTCWSCGGTIRYPPRLVIGDLELALNSHTTVRSYHLDLDYDRDTTCAAMTANPRDPEVWGLQNLSEATWVAEHPTAGTRRIHPGRTIALAAGLIIDFGPTTGKVEP
jgi:DNA-binding helix-hairpin-helix protein with protein kinase domain